jgi:hypothetical protein
MPFHRRAQLHTSLTAAVIVAAAFAGYQLIERDAAPVAAAIAAPAAMPAAERALPAAMPMQPAPLAVEQADLDLVGASIAAYDR